MKKTLVFVAYVVLLTYIASILTGCGTPIKDIYTDENSTTDIPESLEKYLVADCDDQLHVKETHWHGGFRDSYGVYIYQYSKGIGDIIIDDGEWRTLPMTEEEYRDYIKFGFGWPFEEYDYLKEYRLTDKETRGYWRYFGRYTDSKGTYCYDTLLGNTTGGFHEIVIALDGEKTIIYAYQD